MSEFVVWINGVEWRESSSCIDPRKTLLEYIRETRDLKGSKLGCGEGGCGACTVMQSRREESGNIIHRAINACLYPLPNAHLTHIVTVEGVGTPQSPHFIQKAMSGDASQCGFCTPGFVMSMYAAWRRGEKVNLDGNLCRCTGYRPIEDAIGLCGLGSNCCKSGCRKSGDQTKSAGSAGGKQENSNAIKKLKEKKSDLIFPPKLSMELLDLGSGGTTKKKMKPFYWEHPECLWYNVYCVDDLLRLKELYKGNGKIVHGNSEVGIEMHLKKAKYAVILSCSQIQDKEWSQIAFKDGNFVIGAGSNLSDLYSFCKQQLATTNITTTSPAFAKQEFFTCILEILNLFAGTQIRNVAGWAGNLATSSPISDLNPVWCAFGACVCVRSTVNGSRLILVSDFFKGYRQNALSSSEAITSLSIPLAKAGERFGVYKVNKRLEDDISICTGAFRVMLAKNGNSRNRAESKSGKAVVKEWAMAFGGLGPMTLASKSTSKLLVASQINVKEFLDLGIRGLKNEFHVQTGAIGGMSRFRNACCKSFFYKFLLKICGVEEDNLRDAISREGHNLSLAKPLPNTSENLNVVGGMAHTAGLLHSTGTAEYLDDIPHSLEEIYAYPIQCMHAHALILSINTQKALSSPGVIDIVTYLDVPGENKIGPIFDDEHVFVEERCVHWGQIVGLVLGVDRKSAADAAAKVSIEYEVLDAILSIDQAIELQSFHNGYDHCLERGLSMEEISASSDALSKLKVVEGVVRVGGQDHFYLETQAALVHPRTHNNPLTIHSSTQNPTEAQIFAARVLGVPMSDVRCKVKRLGGGFGGKETRSSFLVAALAVAAHKTGRSVRCVLDRAQDMSWSGGRHPFRIDYKAAFHKDGEDGGRIEAISMVLYCNAGHSIDLSFGVMDRAISHVDNVYHLPNIRVSGHVCKTNLPSNTAFRGFGGPQGMFAIERILDRVAGELGIPPNLVRERNFYKAGQLTPFHQTIDHAPITAMWAALKEQCEYQKLWNSCQEFNKKSLTQKQSIAMIPTKFGIAFGAWHLNQASAMVHIYTDGTVLLTHGGIEMGQGLHTKMAQVAAQTLGIPMHLITHGENDTGMHANSSATAASASSDLYGGAIKIACQELAERIREYRSDDASTFAPIAAEKRKGQPSKTEFNVHKWRQCIKSAYLDRTNLTAHAHFKTPGTGYNWKTRSGNLYNYFTWGVACAHTQVDMLTGQASTLGVWICMDIGRALNPLIDRGQIEGAFAQGLGLFTIEQPLILADTGQPLTTGPGAYKIPTAASMPPKLKICLHPSHNDLAIGGSRAVGEPPLFLGASVLFAIGRSITCEAYGGEGVCLLDAPASVDRIRLAIGGRFVEEGEEETERANDWSIELC